MNEQQKTLRRALATLLTGVCHIVDAAAEIGEWEDDPDPGEEAPEERETSNVRAIAKDAA